MSKKLKGILLIIASAFFFALMNLMVRLSGDLPSIQKSFFRNFVALFFALFILIKSGTGLKGIKGNLFPLFMRVSFGTLGILCNFYAIDHMILSDASMLNKLSPFFAVVFSAMFLREKIKPWQLMVVLGAFIGSLFIIKPSLDFSETFPYFVGFLGGMGAGAAYTAVRYLGGRGVQGSVIVFMFSLFSCIVCLPPAIMGFQPMTALQILTLLGAGLAATGGQFCITYAYTYAPARDISVYDYSQIIFSTILGFFVLGQKADVLSILGYVIICSMGIFNFVYSKKQTAQ